jgi:hypothetical protein
VDAVVGLMCLYKIRAAEMMAEEIVKVVSVGVGEVVIGLVNGVREAVALDSVVAVVAATMDVVRIIPAATTSVAVTVLGISC